MLMRVSGSSPERERRMRFAGPSSPEDPEASSTAPPGEAEIIGAEPRPAQKASAAVAIQRADQTRGERGRFMR